MKQILANRSLAVQWSGIRVMFALADEIPDVVNLGIGQPDFDTPEHIRDAGKQALDEGYTRYPPAKGFMDLRVAVAEKLNRENKIIVDPESEIFIAVGAMQVVFNTILHLVEPGDEVIVLDPGYDYYSQIGLFGGKPIPVEVREANFFKVNPKDIEKAITNKTKLIILNSPGNPTGAIFDNDELMEIAALCQKHNIYVLSDEPYEHILFDDKKHISIASFDGMKELTVTAYTLSKSYAMTGWRVGYAAGPKIVIDEMEKLMEHMVSGVTAMAQRAALAAITGSQECVKHMLEKYKKRRQIVHKGLNEIDGFSCILPEATFYAFPNISGTGLNSWDLARYLVQEFKVALVPGSVFGEKGDGYMRLSFAASGAQLKEGLARIKAGVEKIHEKGLPRI